MIVTSTCCSRKQTFVSVCMPRKSLFATGKWFPKSTISVVGLAILYSVHAIGVIEVNFRVQVIVEFHVLGLHLLFKAPDYQIAHQLQFTFGACLSLPSCWQGFQLAWSPLRLQGVLGKHARPEQHPTYPVSTAQLRFERWFAGWAEAFCSTGCLYISFPFQPGYLPNCVLTL